MVANSDKGNALIIITKCIALKDAVLRTINS